MIACPAQVRLFEDAHAASVAAADLFVKLMRECVASRGRFVVSLSGGSSPRGLYKLLGSSPIRENPDWSAMHCFWADERSVHRDHPESNFKLAFDLFLSRIPVPGKNIHRIRMEMELDLAAREYEHELRTVFPNEPWPEFDLVLLGAGEDGHVASLFPGSDGLLEQSRLALPVYLDAPKFNRITLTLPVLNHARHVLVLALGPSKKNIVHEVLAQGNPGRRPAGLVCPLHGQALWYIDREAGATLGELSHP